MFIQTFLPLRIGTMEVKNRLGMAPMGTNYADERGYVTDRLIDYYVARARGGVGMITVEGAFPEIRGKVLSNQLALHDDGVIDGLKRLVDKIHQAGAKAIIQILHAGRQTRKAVCGSVPVAPSAIACPVCKETPHELTHLEIKDIIESHVQAADRAHSAGFDGVELHCAHGYLLNQFLSPYSNKRTDEYGKDTRCRTRIVCQIIDEIRRKTGKELVLGCRMSADEFVEGGLTLKESGVIAAILEKAGIDYLSISGGVYESIHRMIPPLYIPPGSLVHLALGIKKTVKIPVAAVGGFTEPELIENVLRDDKADFVLLGRALLADPEFAVKALRGELREIVPCVGCNNCRRRDLRPLINCMINYQTGREHETKITPARFKKRVVVIGGGPAGMEAARIACTRGHDVILFEKEGRLGGQLNLAAMPPGKERFSKIPSFMEKQIREIGVQIKLNCEADRDIIEKMQPEIVVFATGVEPVVPDLEGLENIPHFFARQLLKEEKFSDLGKKILILGGGQVGCELAELLLTMKKDVNVYIVEKIDKLASDMEAGSRNILLANLFSKADRFQYFTSVFVKKIKDLSKIDFQNSKGSFSINEMDTIIIAAGVNPHIPFLPAGLSSNEVYVIGDAKRPRSALDAVHEGYLTGMKI